LQREVHQYGILLRNTPGAVISHGFTRNVSTRPDIRVDQELPPRFLPPRGASEAWLLPSDLAIGGNPETEQGLILSAQRVRIYDIRPAVSLSES
jgi:hypothetical protein